MDSKTPNLVVVTIAVSDAINSLQKYSEKLQDAELQALVSQLNERMELLKEELATAFRERLASKINRPKS
jgi:hypothetical protein